MIYRGSCHCQRVKFEVETELITAGAYRCNCSLCQKKSIVMKSVPKDFFRLLAGAECLNSYQWNKRIAEHFFCSICGVYTHHKRRRYPDQISVNIACVDNLDLVDDLQIETVNGAAHD